MRLGAIAAALLIIAGLLALPKQVRDFIEGIRGDDDTTLSAPTVTIDEATDGNVERGGQHGAVFHVTLGLVGHDPDDYDLTWWLIDDANDRQITETGKQPLQSQTFRQPLLCDIWTPYPRVAEFIRLRVELLRRGGGRTRKDSTSIELGGIDPNPPDERGPPGEAECA